jgi:hypothetical protein
MSNNKSSDKKRKMELSKMSVTTSSKHTALVEQYSADLRTIAANRNYAIEYRPAFDVVWYGSAFTFFFACFSLAFLSCVARACVCCVYC